MKEIETQVQIVRNVRLIIKLSSYFLSPVCRGMGLVDG